jgi:hypothetical protein
MSEPDKLNYENPRGIPEQWIDRYLNREPRQLALDVMRAFDENWKLQQKLESANLKLWVLGILLGGQALVIGWLVKFVLDRLTH